MITEDYISFETALLLKKKGFEQVGCQKQYNTQGDLCTGYCYGPVAPTLQMAMKWLREVHNIDIIAPPQYDSIKWTYSAIIFKLSIPCMEIRLNDNKDKKEEATEAAIKYCLEHLI